MAEEQAAVATANGGEEVNGISNGLTNGVSESADSSSSQKESGGHKEHKHKHKDKDRDRDRHSSSHKSSHKDKDRHSSSHKSSHKDKDKDRHRSKDRSDKDKERSSKDKDRSDRDKSKSDKDRSDRDKSRSDKDRKDRDKDKERSHDKDKHRDKDRHRDKDKDRHRDKDKDKHRDKDKERSRDKDRKSSSGDKDKDRHHSSHKSSHRDKDGHRSKSKDESRHSKKPAEEGAEEVKVKEEPMDTSVNESNLTMEEINPNPAVDVKEESIESEEEDKLVISEPVQVKEEQNSMDDEEDDDVPLMPNKKMKKEEEEDDDVPLVPKKKVKKEKKRKKNHDEDDYEEDEEDDFKQEKKKAKKDKKKEIKKEVKKETKRTPAKNQKNVQHFADKNLSPSKRQKKQEEEELVWKWWEEEKKEDGRKWTTLEHKGPVFPPAYERIPENIHFLYNDKPMVLSDEAEEVAGFYARMLAHDYTTKEMFNKNFFKDWRSVMTSKEREKITDLKKCDFRKMHQYFVEQSELRKGRSKEVKKQEKLMNEEIVKEYGFCIIDGHKQKIGNFKIEPPGLFRGRGEHPKQGALKRRLRPEQVMINCGKDSNYPIPPEGTKWKEVRHDQNVTWLCCWIENVQGQTKYVMLNAASKLKGEKDWQKYETARRLHKRIDSIRNQYMIDFKSKEMRIRQRAVALYFIDKLALRAGNEKDEDQADTVGCCSLRVEHISLHQHKDGKDNVVVFDFLGKDSIRYYNEVPVEKRVFKNLTMFMDNKSEGDDLFDRLNTQILNKHLTELMDGLTAKVFRTYNASRTLQEQLNKLTDPNDTVPAKVLAYNRANREVAILCNHQRAVPKTHDQSMSNLQSKIEDKRNAIADGEDQVKNAKRAAKGSIKEKTLYEQKKKQLERLKDQLVKLEIQATDKEENKKIALGTSKLNYLDPRISVAWCKKFDIPIEKVYNKTQRQKFQWAIDMATSDYDFMDSNDMNISRNAKGEYDEEEEEEEDYE